MDLVIAPNSVDSAHADVAPISGTPQYFTNGNPGTGIPATQVPAYFLNALQKELVGVIAAAGLTPDKSDNTQLITALNALFLNSAANLGDLGSLPTALINLGFGSGTGWVKLPDGTIIQRGVAGFGSTTGQVVTFPRTFPNACESFVATADGSNSGGSDVVEYVGAATTSTQAVQLSNAGSGAFVAGYLRFFAIGN